MSVIKLSRSGRAFQVILCEDDLVPGTILQVPVVSVLNLVNNNPSGLCVFSRLPFPTRFSRFPLSSVWDGSIIKGGNVVGSVPLVSPVDGDSLSKRSLRDSAASKSYVDKEVVFK